VYEYLCVSRQFIVPKTCIRCCMCEYVYEYLCVSRQFIVPKTCIRCCMCEYVYICIVLLKRDGTRAETRFRLSPKRTSPFKSAGASVQLTAGSRGVRISVSNTGYATFRGSLRVLTTHSIRQFSLHFPSSASPCASRFQTRSTYMIDPLGNPSIHPSMALQPLPGLGLPHKTPPFVPVSLQAMM